MHSLNFRSVFWCNINIIRIENKLGNIDKRCLEKQTRNFNATLAKSSFLKLKLLKIKEICFYFLNLMASKPILNLRYMSVKCSFNF